MSVTLTTEQIKQRQALTNKMIHGSITDEEKKELKSILVREGLKAAEIEDIRSMIAALLLYRQVGEVREKARKLKESAE
jgi:hypothetical protein